MAESKRGHKVVELDEEAQKKKDRMFLIVFFIGLVLVVVGMILLARFLSQG